MRNKWILIILFVSIAVGTLLSPFASPHPDGLERVAEDKGIIDLAVTLFDAPIHDYLFPGIRNEMLSTGIAGFLGVLLTLAIALGVGKILAVKKN